MSSNISRRDALKYAAVAGSVAIGVTTGAPTGSAAPGMRLIDFATRRGDLPR